MFWDKKKKNEPNDPAKDIGLTYAVSFVDIAREIGMLAPEGGFPRVIELMMLADSTCRDIVTDLACREKPPRMTTVLAWCFYAGAGAVIHWNEDWNKLEKVGIFQALTEPRGIFYMDEYVTDILGIGYGTPEAEKLQNYIHMFAKDAYCKSCTDLLNGIVEQGVASSYYRAMYYLGMVYAMERLGFK